MTVQEVKAKLNAVRVTYREYTLAEEKAERFREMISVPMPSAGSDAPKPEHSGNGTENKIVAALWYSEEVDKRFRRYILLSRKVESMINELKYLDEREVLTRRYIMFEKWDDICAKMSIGKSRMFKLNERGIENLCEIYSKVE